MKKIIVFFCCILLSFVVVQAQQDSIATITTPEIIKQNCLLTPQGTIDYCPTYWQSLIAINRSLSSGWSQILLSGTNALTTYLDKELANQTKNKLALIRTTPSTSDLFVAEYKIYMSQLLRKYIDQNSDSSQIISGFFKTTYYDMDQSGLGISTTSLFKNIPALYDDEVILNIAVRNFSINTIDTVEGIYCFSTINGQDYIYPIPVTNAFNKNSITNIVAPVSVKNSPLLDQYGTKNLYCTLVYTIDEVEKYTNRSTVSFTMKQ